ncbi:MAG: VanW family protein [Oscillospiraceae bacterium]|nr:VanW family protein [Oscillospiraceae bacterium]
MIKFFSDKKIPKWAVIAGIVAAVAVVFLIVLAIVTYSSDTSGSSEERRQISVDGVELSGMTEEEAVEALRNAYNERYADAALPLKIDDVYEGEITAEQLGISCDAEEIVRKAFSENQEAGEVPDVIITFDDTMVDALVNSIAEQCKVEAKDEVYHVTDDKLIIDVPADGFAVNVENLKNAIYTRFENEDFEELIVSREVVAPVTVYGIDKIHEEVYKQATDARLEVNGSENKITPHVVGVDFDVENAKKLYDEKPGTRIEIPFIFTQPKVLTKHLEGTLFQYKLTEVETHFSPKKVERTSNVRLAAKYINGTILNPGEEFSYNKVVGPRTKERGFKAAAIFASGEVVDGIGGGICQVSSTLYMAAIKTNMKITWSTSTQTKTSG